MPNLDHAFVRVFDPEKKTKVEENTSSEQKTIRQPDTEVDGESSPNQILVASQIAATTDSPTVIFNVGVDWNRALEPSAEADACPSNVTIESKNPSVSADPSEITPSEITPSEANLQTPKVWTPRLEVDEFAFSQAAQMFIDNADCLSEVVDGCTGQIAKQKLVILRSWSRNAGRTTIGIALANILASRGFNTVLVDGDFDHPELATQLGIRVQEGWETAIHTSNELADLCIASLQDQFAVLPLVEPEVDCYDEKVTKSIANRMRQLEANFDFVLIDAGPGSQLWDSIDLPAAGNLVIHDQRTDPTSDVLQFFERGSQQRSPVVGTIQNFSRAA